MSAITSIKVKESAPQGIDNFLANKFSCAVERGSVGPKGLCVETISGEYDEQVEAEYEVSTAIKEFMNDFMRPFLDKAPESALCAVMHPEGTIAFFSLEKVLLGKHATWYCERGCEAVGAITFGVNFKHNLNHLFKESKRVRQNGQWVKPQ